MKEITLKIYTIDELDENAKQKAIQTMREQLFDIERNWYDMAWRDFIKEIEPDYQYSHNELPENYWLDSDFKNYEYKYHGARLGKYILKAFSDYCEKQWDDFFPENDDCIDHANANEYMFFADGEFYGSNY